MTDLELLEECKIGLGIETTETSFNGILTQKLKAVKSYMIGAGVSTAMLEDDLSVNTIVLGVSDLWNISSGDAKFSMIFTQSVIQLTGRSLTVEV